MGWMKFFVAVLLYFTGNKVFVGSAGIDNGGNVIAIHNKQSSKVSVRSSILGEPDVFCRCNRKTYLRLRARNLFRRGNVVLLKQKNTIPGKRSGNVLYSKTCCRIDLTNPNKLYRYSLTIKLPDLIFTEEFTDPYSEQYKNLASELINGINQLFPAESRLVSVDVDQFRSGSVLADLVLTTKGILSQDMYDVLKMAIEAGKIGGLNVAPVPLDEGPEGTGATIHKIGATVPSAGNNAIQPTPVPSTPGVGATQGVGATAPSGGDNGIQPTPSVGATQGTGATVSTPATTPPYESIGCFQDRADRAIPTMEGSDPTLDGSYSTRQDAIEKCYQAAKKRGFKVFALQNGGWCASSATAAETYSKYGESSACKPDGKGGPWANQVYRIKVTGVSATQGVGATTPSGGDNGIQPTPSVGATQGTGATVSTPATTPPYESIGCFQDRADRAIPTMEGSDPTLDGSYSTRQDAIEKCYQAAKKRGFKVFALQNGGWCASSATAAETYSKYGESSACKPDGKGGPWANQVYRIKVTGVSATQGVGATTPSGGDNAIQPTPSAGATQGVGATAPSGGDNGIQPTPGVGATQGVGATAPSGGDNGIQPTPGVGATQGVGATAPSGGDNGIQPTPGVGATQGVGATAPSGGDNGIQPTPGVGATQRVGATAPSGGDNAIQPTPGVGATQGVGATAPSGGDNGIQPTPGAGATQGVGETAPSGGDNGIQPTAGVGTTQGVGATAPSGGDNGIQPTPGVGATQGVGATAPSGGDNGIQPTPGVGATQGVGATAPSGGDNAIQPTPGVGATQGVGATAPSGGDNAIQPTPGAGATQGVGATAPSGGDNAIQPTPGAGATQGVGATAPSGGDNAIQPTPGAGATQGVGATAPSGGDNAIQPTPGAGATQGVGATAPSGGDNAIQPTPGVGATQGIGATAPSGGDNAIQPTPGSPQTMPQPTPAGAPEGGPVSVPASGTTSSFDAECLCAHNQKRKAHGSPLMTWSPEIAKTAAEWAKAIASRDKMEHDPANKLYGENIYMDWGTVREKNAGHCQFAVDKWYNEIEFYNYNSPGFSLKTGHFTQVVWKKSIKLGVGEAVSASGKRYVVARYEERGNVQGYFRENVPPLVGTRPGPSNECVGAEASQGGTPSPGVATTEPSAVNPTVNPPVGATEAQPLVPSSAVGGSTPALPGQGVNPTMEQATATATNPIVIPSATPGAVLPSPVIGTQTTSTTNAIPVPPAQGLSSAPTSAGQIPVSNIPSSTFVPTNGGLLPTPNIFPTQSSVVGSPTQNTNMVIATSPLGNVPTVGGATNTPVAGLTPVAETVSTSPLGTPVTLSEQIAPSQQTPNVAVTSTPKPEGRPNPLPPTESTNSEPYDPSIEEEEFTDLYNVTGLLGISKNWLKNYGVSRAKLFKVAIGLLNLLFSPELANSGSEAFIKLKNAIEQAIMSIFETIDSFLSVTLLGFKPVTNTNLRNNVGQRLLLPRTAGSFPVDAVVELTFKDKMPNQLEPLEKQVSTGKLGNLNVVPKISAVIVKDNQLCAGVCQEPVICYPQCPPSCCSRPSTMTCGAPCPNSCAPGCSYTCCALREYARHIYGYSRK